MRKLLILLLAASWLAGCSGTRTRHSSAPPPPETKGGGYYLDDGPEASPPANLHAVPDAVPRNEPLHRYANRPYEVKGVSYAPVKETKGFRQTGIASWYGKRFHGKPTASGEPYNMYAMTAAHPTLPIPSYAKVTSIESGKSVIVRINDRGPFHPGRVIDLSYTAAHKLGLLGRGSAQVSVESVGPETALIERDVSIPETVAYAPTPALSAVQDPAGKPGYYLQLGAFGSPENAEKLLARAREALNVSADRVQMTLGGRLHRVKMGPFADQFEANGWLAKIRSALGISAILVTP